MILIVFIQYQEPSLTVMTKSILIETLRHIYKKTKLFGHTIDTSDSKQKIYQIYTTFIRITRY